MFRLKEFWTIEVLLHSFISTAWKFLFSNLNFRLFLSYFYLFLLLLSFFYSLLIFNSFLLLNNKNVCYLFTSSFLFYSFLFVILFYYIHFYFYFIFISIFFLISFLCVCVCVRLLFLFTYPPPVNNRLFRLLLVVKLWNYSRLRKTIVRRNWIK